MRFARWPVVGLPGCELVLNLKRVPVVPSSLAGGLFAPIDRLAPPAVRDEWFIAINDAGGDWSQWVEKGAPSGLAGGGALEQFPAEPQQRKRGR